MSVQNVPYEFTPEFIQAKRHLQNQVWPVLQQNLHGTQSTLCKEDAACAYMLGLAQLHERFLAFSWLPEPQRREYLRIGICEAMEEVGHSVPGCYQALMAHRDALIRRMVERAERAQSNGDWPDTTTPTVVAGHQLEASRGAGDRGDEVLPGSTAESSADAVAVRLPHPAGEASDRRQSRKADPTLLGDKEAVNYCVAEAYLGVTERQRQKLLKKRALTTLGGGRNRMITTASLRKYLPPQKTRTNPN